MMKVLPDHYKVPHITSTGHVCSINSIAVMKNVDTLVGQGRAQMYYLRHGCTRVCWSILRYCDFPHTVPGWAHPHCTPIVSQDTWTIFGPSKISNTVHTLTTLEIIDALYIRELVDSLYRDGVDAQYVQYLSKSHITSPQGH